MVGIVTIVTAVAGVVVTGMGVKQLRDPEWAARQSASFTAERQGIEGTDPDEIDLKEGAVDRARTGGKLLLGLGALLLVLAVLQVV